MRRTAGDSVADRLNDEVIAKAESLRAMPLRQRERVEFQAGLRALHVDGYLLFYRVDEDRVSIVRVLHGSRNITAKLFSRAPSR
jgi:toxin ParE1/3/4